MKSAKRPSLIALDFKQGRATRYWPKLGDQRPATFLTQTAQIFPLDGLWQLGADNGAVLEQFRSGKINVENLPDEPELEQA